MSYQLVLVSLALLVTCCSCCTCPPDTSFVDQICSASFVGRISVLGNLQTEGLQEYYRVRVVQPNQNLYKGNVIQRAYRVINPLEEPCTGAVLDPRKEYLITGLPTVNRRFIDYTTCQLVIEWSDYLTNPAYADLRTFLENFDQNSCA